MVGTDDECCVWHTEICAAGPDIHAGLKDMEIISYIH